MKCRLNVFALILFYVLLCVFSLSADSAEPELEELTPEDLLFAGKPFIYGEEAFIKRINKRTGGKREAIGLVLSGGSARAMAHIGVLKYLEEINCTPDFIISNSMGSIIALLYGAGFSPDQIYDILSSTPLNSLFDISLPINKGLMSVSNFESLVTALVGKNKRLEDFPIPVMVVCEDLKTKRQVLISEGDFASIMNASFALPFYFDSVEWRDHLLVDGGIANICPVSLAYKYSKTNIVSTTFYASKSINLKNPLSNLNVSFDIGKRRCAVKDILSHTDEVWIRCAVEDISFMKFDELEYIKNKGFESAKAMDSELKSLLKKSRFASKTKAMESSKNDLNNTNSDLNILRENNKDVIDKVENKYAVYNRLPINNFTSYFTISNKNTFYRNSKQWLKNDLMLGLKYLMRFKYTDFYVFGGSAYQLYNSGKLLSPVFQVASESYIPGNIKLSLEGDLYYKTDLYSYFNSALYGYQGLEFKLTNKYANYYFSINENFEIFKRFQKDDKFNLKYDYQHALLRPSLDCGYRNDFFDSKNQLGFMFMGLHNSMHYLTYFRTDLNFMIPKTGLLFALRADLRYALDKKKNVPYFLSDSYNTADKNLILQGLGGQAVKSEVNYLIASGFSIKYAPVPINFFSIAELLTVRNTGLELYSNFLWYKKTSMPNIELGAGLFTSPSLLGLNSFTMNLKVAYEFNTKKVVWKLVFNN